jgi:hypothetical protein
VGADIRNAEIDKLSVVVPGPQARGQAQHELNPFELGKPLLRHCGQERLILPANTRGTDRPEQGMAEVAVGAQRALAVTGTFVEIL